MRALRPEAQCQLLLLQRLSIQAQASRDDAALEFSPDANSVGKPAFINPWALWVICDGESRSYPSLGSIKQ